MSDEQSPERGMPERDPQAYAWFKDIRQAILAVPQATESVPFGVPSMRVQYSCVTDMYSRSLSAKRYTERLAYTEEQRAARAAYIECTRYRDPHSAVVEVLKDGWRPCQCTLAHLVLEWPSVASDGRLAYLRSEDAHERARWTVTTAQKYIKARWAYLPDHVVRDLVARTESKDPVILHNIESMVDVVQHGPTSCMKWGSSDYLGDPHSHPYAAYDPSLGWRMVARPASYEEEREVKWGGRCLVLHPSRGPWVDGETLQGAVFVRSYKHTMGHGYSFDDPALESWLTSQGATKLRSWPDGAMLRKTSNAPYLDSRETSDSSSGSGRRAYEEDGLFVIARDGDLVFNRTDGSYDDNENRFECSVCGSHYHDDDEFIYVGYCEDEAVGPCCSDSYVHGYGHRGRKYYFHVDNAVNVDGTWYHEDYLDVNNIVELYNGDYCSKDDAFHCPIDCEWYPNDDGIVTEDEGMVHNSNAWQCAGSEYWYSTNTESVRVDGLDYHPDHAPEDDEPVDEFDKPYDKPEGSISNELQQPLDLSQPCVEPAPRYFRRREDLIAVYRVIGNAVTFAYQDDDLWLASAFTESEVTEGTYFFPVASFDERIYSHLNAPDMLYRAGRHCIDVLFRNSNSWEEDAGEANTNLTAASCRYHCVSHFELETA